MICEYCRETTGAYHNHHISYFPEKIMVVCIPCHHKIHEENNEELCPPKNHSKIFYSIKGYIRDSKGFAIRKLTKEEKELKEGGYK